MLTIGSSGLTALLVHGGRWQAVVGFKQTSKFKPSQPAQQCFMCLADISPKKTQDTWCKNTAGFDMETGRSLKRRQPSKLGYSVTRQQRCLAVEHSPSMLLQVPACVNTFLRYIFKGFQFLWSFLPSPPIPPPKQSMDVRKCFKQRKVPVIPQSPHLASTTVNLHLAFVFPLNLSFSGSVLWLHSSKPKATWSCRHHTADPPLRERNHSPSLHSHCSDSEPRQQWEEHRLSSLLSSHAGFARQRKTSRVGLKQEDESGMSFHKGLWFTWL